MEIKRSPYDDTAGLAAFWASWHIFRATSLYKSKSKTLQDPQSGKCKKPPTMSLFFIVLIVGIAFILILQISKVYEYISLLNGKGKAERQTNRINGTMMILFLAAGLVGLYLCHQALKDKLLPHAASIQGESIDHMVKVTLIITGIVLLGTEIMLFGFAWRFRARPGRTGKYFSQFSARNSRIEIIWTSVTLIVLLILIIIGLREWFKITGDAPPNAMIVEVTGQQFAWTFRYPGLDGELGRKDYRLIDPTRNNPLGQDWRDPANRDDIVVTGTMHLIVDRPVKFLINSQDVIHDVGLPYFRLKMDAVPGVPTSLWFTPTITNAGMKKITGDNDFVYELACDQLCGNQHFAMRGLIIVETAGAFKQWISSQKPQYQLAVAQKHREASDSTVQRSLSANTSEALH